MSNVEMALRVIVLSVPTRIWLRTADPKALEQALDALKMSDEDKIRLMDDERNFQQAWLRDPDTD